MPTLRKRKQLQSKAGESYSPSKRIKVEASSNVKNEVIENADENVDTAKTDGIGNTKDDYYEELRIKNIEENQRFLERVGVLQAKEELNVALSKPKKELKRQSKESRYINYHAVLPRRSSMRIRRIDPEGQPLPEIPVSEVIEENEHPRKPSGPLLMSDYLQNIQTDEEKDKILTNLANTTRIDVKLTKSNSSRESFQKSLLNLTIRPGHVAKVVPQRIFSLAVHPSESRTLVAAGDKWGRLGLWDVDAVDDNDGIYLFEPHSRPVSCLAFHPEDPAKLLSCSYDGVLRSCDFEKKTFSEVYATPEDEDARCMAFDFHSPNELFVAQSDGCVAFVDTRTNIPTVFSLTHRTLKMISIHPTSKHYFLTPCNDGNVHVWDARKMQSKKNPKPLETLVHSKSVNSAYFSPVTGQSIVTTSMDDRIRLYNSSDMSSIKLNTTIKHDNHTGRWLTGFRANWHPRRDDLFVVGCMMRPRRIQLFADTGAVVKEYQNEAGLTAVSSINVFHPTRDILVGGNSSGRIVVFS